MKNTDIVRRYLQADEAEFVKSGQNWGDVGQCATSSSTNRNTLFCPPVKQIFLEQLHFSCPACNQKIEVKKEDDLITGCPFCNHSFCD